MPVKVKFLKVFEPLLLPRCHSGKAPSLPLATVRGSRGLAPTYTDTDDRAGIKPLLGLSVVVVKPINIELA